MKYIILSCFLLLVISSIAIYKSFPDISSDVPVIYWVTDNNPARGEQVRLFHEWLVENGHTTAEGKPMVELRVDSANAQPAKKIIQGVSGVGGDIVDMHQIQLFVDIGLLEDITEWGEQLGFSPDKTYPAIGPSITSGGRQYSFPCNVFSNMYFVNRDTFRKYNLEPPEGRWSVEEFEALGRQLDAAANPEGERKTVFIAPYVRTDHLYMTMGLSMYNETLTRCTLDDPRFVRALKLKKKWMTGPDRILPTAADQASFDTSSGYGGSILQLFNRGSYGTFMMGRFALIQLRKFGNLDLALAEPPNAGFPVTDTGTRCAAIYVGGPNKELAKYFLAFLASEKYNMQIVRDADALPPVPTYTELEAFSRPPDFPNEWGVHDAFANAVKDIAVPSQESPFVLNTIANTRANRAEDGFITGNRLTAEQAAEEAASAINAEIARSLEENPDLLPLYEQRLAQQKEIDRLRAAGEKVPLELIANPFYRAYYQFKGWSE